LKKPENPFFNGHIIEVGVVCFFSLWFAGFFLADVGPFMWRLYPNSEDFFSGEPNFSFSLVVLLPPGPWRRFFSFFGGRPLLSADARRWRLFVPGRSASRAGTMLKSPPAHDGIASSPRPFCRSWRLLKPLSHSQMARCDRYALPPAVWYYFPIVIRASGGTPPLFFYSTFRSLSRSRVGD